VTAVRRQPRRQRSGAGRTRAAAELPAVQAGVTQSLRPQRSARPIQMWRLLSQLFSGREPTAFARLAVFPDGRRVYAIGDVHGRADLLGELLQLINRDNAMRPP
jgi:hypothetical protein